MKKIGYAVGSFGMLALPLLASAQLTTTGGGGGGLEDLVTNIVEFTNTFLVPAVLALGFLAFVWGMFQYFIAGGANDESKEKGKSLMIWATVGFVMIIIFWGLVNFLATSIGLEEDTITAPTAIPLPATTP